MQALKSLYVPNLRPSTGGVNHIQSYHPYDKQRSAVVYCC